jgi:hypothetical protein
MIPKGALSTTVLGARAIDMIGEPGEEVRWILEVKAPLKGLNYYAIFGVHVIPLLKAQDEDRPRPTAGPP